MDKTSLRTKPKCILISKHGMIKKTETAALVGWFGSRVLSKYYKQISERYVKSPRLTTTQKYLKKIC